MLILLSNIDNNISRLLLIQGQHVFFRGWGSTFSPSFLRFYNSANFHCMFVVSITHLPMFYTLVAHCCLISSFRIVSCRVFPWIRLKYCSILSYILSDLVFVTNDMMDLIRFNSDFFLDICSSKQFRICSQPFEVIFLFDNFGIEFLRRPLTTLCQKPWLYRPSNITSIVDHLYLHWLYCLVISSNIIFENALRHCYSSMVWYIWIITFNNLKDIFKQTFDVNYVLFM